MAGNEKLPVVEIPEELTTLEQVREFIHKTITRRSFNKGMGIAGLGVVAFQLGCGGNKQTVPGRQVFVADAKGLVVADNSLCVGCRRCELACSGFNEGKASPTISNIKINRNLLYGVNGAKDNTGGGLYGSFVVVQNTCLQCPHPVPCATACPHGAIQVTEPVNARVINKDVCQGCGICAKACPWEMPSLDGIPLGTDTKAYKCHLCNGAPECVAACPAGALQYIPWTDMTKVTPPRQTVPASIQVAPDVASTCAQCH